MGRGDKKTAKGKRAMGSYGITRKKKSSSFTVKNAEEKVEVKETKVKKAPVKKATSKKDA